MFYVYFLQSISYPDQIYTGYTTDIEQRIKNHNSGSTPHTAKYKPWRLHAYFAFEDKEIAYNFEKYLKTGSGRAFAKKKLWSNG